MNDWISVKDKLPDKSKEVLAYGSGYAFNHSGKPTMVIKTCWFDKDDKDWCYYFDYDEYDVYLMENVTHWMELPEEPKEKFMKEKENCDKCHEPFGLVDLNQRKIGLSKKEIYELCGNCMQQLDQILTPSGDLMKEIIRTWINE